MRRDRRTNARAPGLRHLRHSSIARSAVLALALALAHGTAAAQSLDSVIERLDRLEQENLELRREIDALKVKSAGGESGQARSAGRASDGESGGYVRIDPAFGYQILDPTTDINRKQRLILDRRRDGTLTPDSVHLQGAVTAIANFQSSNEADKFGYLMRHPTASNQVGRRYPKRQSIRRSSVSRPCSGTGSPATPRCCSIRSRASGKAPTPISSAWFTAAHIVTSHSNGISALQLQAQLGLGSYKSAWLLLHKLRRAMVAPDRSLLEDLVEIDEATLPLRTKQDPPTGGQGRSPQGKMRIAGAVELSPEGEPRRIRLAPIGDFSACSLHAFVAATSAPGARVITDGWRGYGGLPDHEPKVVGATPAHLVLACIHRVFSNLKRWALGTFHGLRRPHLRRYLDEFVFRWNRRRHTATAFDTLLGIGTRLQPAGYRDIVGQRA